MSTDRADDQFAIRNLLARAAALADSSEMDEYMTVFTEDVVMEAPGAPPREGHAGMRAGSQRLRDTGKFGPGSHSMHFLGASQVSVDGDEASSETPYLFWTGLDEPTPTLTSSGRYIDRLRRTPDGWKLAHRRISRD